MWRVALPALLLLALGAVQMCRVSTNDLSRWKGGGMGMYSEFHPRERELWLRVESEQGEAKAPRAMDASFVGADALEGLKTQAFDCARLGSEACMLQMAEAVKDDGVHPPFRISLMRWGWQDGALVRRRVKEVRVGK